MRLSIRHSLEYLYSEGSLLDPHFLYLYPRISPGITIEEFKLEIFPKPSYHTVNTDAEGNVQHLIFFNQETTSLNIIAESIVQTEPNNPFGFVAYPFDSQVLPIKYSIAEQRTLLPYLSEIISEEVKIFADKIYTEVQGETMPFLTKLNSYFSENFRYEIRDEGPPTTPETTLATQSGSCRDYAVLFIAACNAVNIAARFVSGYYWTPDAPATQHLHAWAEVFLPGGGWRGFDPTQNSLVTETHIPLAASAVPEAVTPVFGNFRGPASAVLSHHVFVEKLCL